MPPNDENLPGQAGAEVTRSQDPFEPGGGLLDRVRAVARRIVERVRRVTQDTHLDHTALPTDPTAELPPV